MKNPLYQNIGDELNLGRLNFTETIQTLWSGYGELVRLRFETKSIIVKHVKLPKQTSHPRGWDTDISHQRKVHSYQVETAWYQNFSSPSDERCRIPKGLKCFQNKNEWLIVMEDLQESGFTDTTYEADDTHLVSCLRWLANFHAKYMGVKSDVLWESGTYWHLETRPDELKALKDKELKEYASLIDKELKSAKYQTIVHGDAKLANFCFSSDASRCAAVDFQYVGQGCGMKDVIYFISSAVEPEDCENMEAKLLDIYFKELRTALEYYQPNINAQELEKEYRDLFVIAWADFQRFIKGWATEHYKINDYSENLSAKAIEYLSSKYETRF